MFELGNIQNAAQSEHSTKPTKNGFSNSTKPTAKIKFADDDTAAAVFLNPLQAQTEYIQQDRLNTNALPSQQTEFDFEQILDNEKDMTKGNVNLETGRCWLKKIHEEALKALRCQGNPDPERVLHLLKDDVTEQNTLEVKEQSVTTPGQKASIQAPE